MARFMTMGSLDAIRQMSSDVANRRRERDRREQEAEDREAKRKIGEITKKFLQAGDYSAEGMQKFQESEGLTGDQFEAVLNLGSRFMQAQRPAKEEARYQETLAREDRIRQERADALREQRGYQEGRDKLKFGQQRELAGLRAAGSGKVRPDKDRSKLGVGLDRMFSTGTQFVPGIRDEKIRAQSIATDLASDPAYQDLTNDQIIQKAMETITQGKTTEKVADAWAAVPTDKGESDIGDPETYTVNAAKASLESGESWATIDKRLKTLKYSDKHREQIKRQIGAKEELASPAEVAEVKRNVKESKQPDDELREGLSGKFSAEQIEEILESRGGVASAAPKPDPGVLANLPPIS